jgi:hypothetical protein
LCDVCNKSFSQQGSLKKHQCKHDGEQPFSCDVWNVIQEAEWFEDTVFLIGHSGI